MNKDTKERMEKLIQWLNADYQEWIEAARARSQKAGTELFFSPPTERDYAVKRLGVDPASFSRWKNLLNPINENNILLIAVNTGSKVPLDIFGYNHLDSELQDVVINWRKRSPEERKIIVRLAQFGSEPQSQNVSPINSEV
jgi:hypothetical protein